MKGTKYELTQETKYIADIDGTTLYRIRALKDFADVKSGDLGGWIEKEENLSQEGDAWVSDDACVRDNAKVSGNTRVSDDACVRDNAKVSGNARVSGHALVEHSARVSENALVSGIALVGGGAWVKDNAQVRDNARVSGSAIIDGTAHISGHACVNSSEDYATTSGFGSEYRTTTFFRQEDGSIGVQCGCFYGTLEEFRAKVRKTYPSDKKGKEYLMIADLMEYRFTNNQPKFLLKGNGLKSFGFVRVLITCKKLLQFKEEEKMRKKLYEKVKEVLVANHYEFLCYDRLSFTLIGVSFNNVIEVKRSVGRCPLLLEFGRQSIMVYNEWSLEPITMIMASADSSMFFKLGQVLEIS